MELSTMANQITVNSGTGNITVTTSRAVIGTVANVASANYANFAGEVVDASQPNITSVGTLSNLNVANTITTVDLVVTGNFSVGNLIANSANYANFAGIANVANTVAGANVTGTVANATFATTSGTANSATVAASANAVAGANVTGTVANATFATSAGTANTANSATVAASANSVAVANVSGIGNIATVNLDGSASNVLYGNGVFAPAAGGNTANANYANFAGTAFSVALANVSGAGNIASINLDGNVSNTLLGNGTFGPYQANATILTGTILNNGVVNSSLTSVGTLTGLSVNGNITAANITANTGIFTGNGSGLTNIAGANVTGTVANATFALDAANANVANTANSVAVANVSGIGNIATVNLDGNVSNVLSGNGMFVALPTVSANANYANFAGDVVNSSQSNITSLGNLTTLQVGTGTNDTLRFVPAGSNLVTSAGNVVVAQTRITTATAPTDATVLSGNAGGETYTQQLFVPAGSNVATSGSVIYSADSALGAGNAAVPGSITQRVYTGGSDLTTGNVGTSLDMILGGGGVLVNQKTAPSGVQAGTGLINTISYGEAADPAASVGLRFQRRRGNSNNRLSLEPNDYVGNIEWRPGRGGSNFGQTAKLGAKVDSSYTANSNPVPIGIEMSVVNSSNTALVHSFYANGNVNFSGNISATNLGNIVSVNLDGSSSNVLYGNGVFAAAGGGANANYANFAGDVVNSAQANITSVGNLVSLQVGNSVANTVTTKFVPVGANITTLSGDVFVNNTRTSYDDADVLANGVNTQDAVVMPADTGNATTQSYTVNYLVQDLANTSNIATIGTDTFNISSYDAGNFAGYGSRTLSFYTPSSQLANANPNTTTDFIIGDQSTSATALFINQKMPTTAGAPAGIIGIMNYGYSSNQAQSTALFVQRRRGNNSGGTSTRDELQANDYLGNIAWRGAGATNGNVNSGIVTFGAKVDGSYGGPGNVMPIGAELTVINSSNTALSHSFYANGNVSFAGNITATNLGNIATINLDGSNANVLYGNGVFAAITAPTPTSIQNGNSKVDFTGSGGDLRIQIDNQQFADFRYGRQFILTGVQGDFSNAASIKLDNGTLQVINEDLGGGLPSFEFKSYYTTGGTIAPYVFQRARGNLVAPANAQSGDAIMNQSFQAYSNTGFVQAGTFSATVTNNDNAGNIRTRIETSTANNNDGSEIKLNTDIVNVAANSQIYLSANNSNVSGNLNVAGNINYTKTFGSFTSNATQTNSNVGNAVYMTLNNDEGSNGVSIVSNSQITVARTGRYNLQFSAQLEKTDSGTDQVEIWLTKNGSAVANSATQLELAGNGAKAVAAWNWVDNVTSANTYYQIAWGSSDANVQLTAIPSANTLSGVNVPSLIVTVVPVGA
jgi:hypothetical protein